MAIPTSRTHQAALPLIDTERCNGCGLCVQVCKDGTLRLVDGKAASDGDSHFGCFACGHCMAICPQEAIVVSGRCLSPADLTELPPAAHCADYLALAGLMRRRRSIREFRDREVPGELLDQVLEAVRTAPMGLPPSDVHVLVLDSPDKVRRFSAGFCLYLEGMKWLVSPWFLPLLRLFAGKATHLLMRDFVRPLVQAYTGGHARGEDLVTYGAPAALYFYGSPYCDPADPVVAATYAMLAAESLGLGGCLLGGVHPLIQQGRGAARFRRDHGIRHRSREGLILILGYPRVVYQRGIRRSLAAVDRP